MDRSISEQRAPLIKTCSKGKRKRCLRLLRPVFSAGKLLRLNTFSKKEKKWLSDTVLFSDIHRAHSGGKRKDVSLIQTAVLFSEIP